MIAIIDIITVISVKSTGKIYFAMSSLRCFIGPKTVDKDVVHLTLDFVYGLFSCCRSVCSCMLHEVLCVLPALLAGRAERSQVQFLRSRHSESVQEILCQEAKRAAES